MSAMITQGKIEGTMCGENDFSLLYKKDVFEVPRKQILMTRHVQLRPGWALNYDWFEDFPRENLTRLIGLSKATMDWTGTKFIPTLRSLDIVQIDWTENWPRSRPGRFWRIEQVLQCWILVKRFPRSSFEMIIQLWVFYMILTREMAVLWKRWRREIQKEYRYSPQVFLLNWCGTFNCTD